MNARNVALAAVLGTAPFLMAPSCGSTSEARFDYPTSETYCQEDVPVSAVVSNALSSAAEPDGVLGVFDTRNGSVRILQHVRIGRGETITLTGRIPWSDLASRRGDTFTLFADVAVLDQRATAAGSTIKHETYDAALGRSTISLFGRATRAFTVCKEKGPAVSPGPSPRIGRPLPL